MPLMLTLMTVFECLPWRKLHFVHGFVYAVVRPQTSQLLNNLMHQRLRKQKMQLHRHGMKLQHLAKSAKDISQYNEWVRSAVQDSSSPICATCQQGKLLHHQLVCLGVLLLVAVSGLHLVFCHICHHQMLTAIFYLLSPCYSLCVCLLDSLLCCVDLSLAMLCSFLARGTM